MVFGGITVRSYRFFLRDRENVVIGSGTFDADDNDDAISFARIRSAASPPSCHSYQVLQDDQLIHSESLLPSSEMETRN